MTALWTVDIDWEDDEPPYDMIDEKEETFLPDEVEEWEEEDDLEEIEL